MANVTYSAGIATAYGAAVRGGYTGTYDDFCRQQAEYAESAAAVEQAKEDAEAAASAADTSKTAAAGSASAAATSAGQASTSATNAANSATEANASKNAAATSATEAGNSATAAAGSASDAQNSADDAQASAEAAAQSAASVDVHADGNYPEMTVGTSEQLLSTQYVTDKTPYLYRTTGGSSNVGNRECVRGITGGTVAWNQLCNGLSANVPSGHKYLSKISTTWSVSASTGAAITGLTGGSDMVIDLTQLFGTTIADYIYGLEQATAGAGVAFFRKLFPNDYYPYNAGELKSVEGVSSHEMVGFNQWDEEWRIGAFNSNGEFATGYNFVCSKNPIRVFPNTIYSTSKNILIWEFDSDMNIVRAAAALSAGSAIRMDANVHYIHFHTNYEATTYNHDICINLSWDGERDGEYEEYVEHVYELDPDLELRGIPQLSAGNDLYYDGDVYAPDGAVNRRYGVKVFDGTTGSWAVHNGAFYQLINGYKVRGYHDITAISDKFVFAGQNSGISDLIDAGRGKFALRRDSNAVQFYPLDENITTSTQFNSWLASNPVTVVYELATPTTETADPYTEVQICDGNGTEEFVSTSIVPVGHVTEYPENLRAKIDAYPTIPTTDGTYMLKVTNGIATFELVTE